MNKDYEEELNEEELGRVTAGLNQKDFEIRREQIIAEQRIDQIKELEKLKDELERKDLTETPRNR